MGAGDWVMATAQVKRLYSQTGHKVLVVGRDGRVQVSEVFDNNPKIATSRGRGAVQLINGPGARPYIADKTAERWTWKRWQIEPGEIYLTPQEQVFGAAHGGRVLIEPNTKVDGSNKAWFFDRWQQLVDRGGEFVQVGPPGTRRLERVHFVETHSFRQACSVLAASRAFVGTEGGLHHAAAALGVPAVVLFSEFISPEITGYSTHRNLWRASTSCGSRVPCAGCRASMEAITVDDVHANLQEFL